MDTNNFEQTMQVFLDRRPFRRFTVALKNGDRVEVDHPRALAMRDGVAIYVAPGNVPVIFDHDGVSQVIGDLSGQPGG
jgi:hypothetical protein